MKLSLSTAIDFRVDITDILPKIRSGGFEYVEVWCGAERWGKFEHFDINSEEKLKEVLSLLEKISLKVSSVHAIYSENIDLSHPDEEKRSIAMELIKRSCDVLKMLNGDIVVIHPASVPFLDVPDKRREEELRFKYAKENITEICNYAGKLGLKVAIENQLPHIFGGEPEVIRRLIQEINCDYLKVCFDTSHASFFRDKTIYDVLEALIDLTITTHISDSNQIHDEHLVPGEGKIDWSRVQEIFRRHNYSGVFNIEVLKIPSGRNLDEVCASLFKFAQSFIT